MFRALPPPFENPKIASCKLRARWCMSNGYRQYSVEIIALFISNVGELSGQERKNSMAKAKFQVGDQLLDRSNPLIRAEVISMREFMGLPHYKFRLWSPCTADREISLSEAGAYIKFMTITDAKA